MQFYLVLFGGNTNVNKDRWRLAAFLSCHFGTDNLWSASSWHLFVVYKKASRCLLSIIISLGNVRVLGWGRQKCGFCFLSYTHCSKEKENFVWNSFLTFDIFQELDLPSTNYFMTNSFLLAFLSLECRWSCQKILWFLNCLLLTWA